MRLSRIDPFEAICYAVLLACAAAFMGGWFYFFDKLMEVWK